ncbi:MAG TPA: hypothetical protein VI122_01690 [Thermoleophilaceae bacterium]
MRHVLYTSIINPEPEYPSAVAADHRATEEALLDSGIEWTFLRNSIYAEYQVPVASQAIASGRHVHNSGDGSDSFVSRVDCAAAAAGALAGAAQAGRAYDVTGPQAISAADLAAIAGELSGLRSRSGRSRTTRTSRTWSSTPTCPSRRHATSRASAPLPGRLRRDGERRGRAAERRPPRSFREVLTANLDELVPT